MKQVAEKEGGVPGLLFRGGGLSIEPPPPLGFIPRHIGPADVLSIGQDTGLNRLMLTG
jgi:hypothetical protein